MWHYIGQQISQQIQQKFNCDEVRQVTSGDSHRAFTVSDGKQHFFIKINEKLHLANFNGEVEGLEHLTSTELFKIPKVICTGTVSDHSFLVLEYIQIESGTKDNWFQFGQNLAQLHKNHTQKMYGWQEDNFIGLTVQPNCWQNNWSVFFSEQRIGFILQLLLEKGHDLADIDRVVNTVKSLLKGHHPKASMLHGDLWQGNTGFHKGQPVLYDPAFYFGDRETDLAMSELFGRFPDPFYQGYSDKWPIDADYLFRKPVYQLYHVLNHALLFGGHYLNSARSTLKNLDS
jgi:fructosamine-3-kinase